MRKTKYLNSNMNSLGKHTTNSTSTDMLNYHCQIKSLTQYKLFLVLRCTGEPDEPNEPVNI